MQTKIVTIEMFDAATLLALETKYAERGERFSSVEEMTAIRADPMIMFDLVRADVCLTLNRDVVGRKVVPLTREARARYKANR